MKHTRTTPLFQARIRGDVRGQDFDGDRAIQACVTGFVDFPHAPSAEGGLDFVRAERGAGLEGHQGLPDVAQRPQRPKLLGSERRLLAWGELLRQGLVHLPLRLKERGVVLDQVGPLLVEAVQAHGVVPQVV